MKFSAEAYSQSLTLQWSLITGSGWVFQVPRPTASLRRMSLKEVCKFPLEWRHNGSASILQGNLCFPFSLVPWRPSCIWHCTVLSFLYRLFRPWRTVVFVCLWNEAQQLTQSTKGPVHTKYIFKKIRFCCHRSIRVYTTVLMHFRLSTIKVS